MTQNDFNLNNIPSLDDNFVTTLKFDEKDDIENKIEKKDNNFIFYNYIDS